MRWSRSPRGDTSVRFVSGIVNRVRRNAIGLAICRRDCYIFDITVRPWLLSVTESVVLPPHSKKQSHVRHPQIQSARVAYSSGVIAGLLRTAGRRRYYYSLVARLSWHAGNEKPCAQKKAGGRMANIAIITDA
jgi:hypothetical protein